MKKIIVNDAVLKEIERWRRDDEPVSDTIIRAFQRRPRLTEVAGLGKDIPDEEIEKRKKAILDTRKESRKGAYTKVELMWGLDKKDQQITLKPKALQALRKAQKEDEDYSQAILRLTKSS